MTTRPLITTDCHLAPPPQLSDELPERFRSQVTHLEQRSDGTYLVRPDMLPEGMREAMGDAGDAITAPGTMNRAPTRDGNAGFIQRPRFSQALRRSWSSD